MLFAEIVRHAPDVGGLDIIAPSAKAATSMLANFKQVVKGGDLRIHPLIGKLIEPEAAEKLGVKSTQT